MVASPFEDIEEVINAIKRVMGGKIALSEKMAPKLMDKLQNKNVERASSLYELLSDRELEVFRYLGHGLKTRDIAGKIGLSPKTISVYRDHIKQKLKLKDSVEMLKAAFLWVEEEGAS